ncbi:hypothetical protein ACFVH6_25825 [Spirillospora sp. NPDC127200]
MTPNVSTDQAMEMAAKVGRRIARDYPGVEADDIASAALLALAERVDILPADHGAGYVYKLLEKAGRTHAAQERYERVIGTSQYIYTPQEVRALLQEAYYDPSAWDTPSRKDDWLSAEISEGTVGISLMDIKSAMDRISPQQREVLNARFGRGEEISERYKVARAIDALTRCLNYITNHYNAKPRQKPVSTARAQHLTDAGSHHEGRAKADALTEYQRLQNTTASAPAGTYFDWDQ